MSREELSQQAKKIRDRLETTQYAAQPELWRAVMELADVVAESLKAVEGK